MTNDLNSKLAIRRSSARIRFSLSRIRRNAICFRVSFGELSLHILTRILILLIKRFIDILVRLKRDLCHNRAMFGVVESVACAD